MQVVASARTIYVECFTDDEKTWAVMNLHGFGRHRLNRKATTTNLTEIGIPDSSHLK